MMYISGMPSQIIKYQEKALKLFSGRLEDFYLAGGTALSLYYFHHRESLDLDFFTQHFNKAVIDKVIGELSGKIDKKIELVGWQNKKKMVKMAVYIIHLSKREKLKIDFIEDWLKIIKPVKVINGITVLSLEDIYLRKIHTVTGSAEIEDVVGRKIMLGGRQEAKDFFDLYCLSTVFMPLYKFAHKYCEPVLKEAMVRWFRTYDRMDIKTGLLELRTREDVDYKLMEKHFKKEIDKLIEKEVGL